eukprot:13313016-Ditylum_brightwellii.AAC.1
MYVHNKIGPNSLIVSQNVTPDEYFNSAVTCTTVPFQGGLVERPIGHNSWVRDYNPNRGKAATGSTVDTNSSSQEVETHNNFFSSFILDQDNSPSLFSEEQQTDIQAPIDVPSANTMSRRLVLAVPDKVSNSDMKLVDQTYEEFFDLFPFEQFGPERAFQAAVSEHPISMFMPEPKSFQEILKQPQEIRKLWLKATESELDNLISNEIF